MNEFSIKTNLESPQEKYEEITIEVDEKTEEDFLYKFSIGYNGTWTTLQDFGEEDKVIWIPEEDGIYNIMVQAKTRESNKSFDYLSKMDFAIGDTKEKLITNVYLENSKLKLGEKLIATVETSKIPVVYKYWINEDGNWNLIKDYSAENKLSVSMKSPGQKELLVECKELNSKNKYDDFIKITFQVEEIEKIQITDFKVLTPDLICYNELVFQVDATYDDNRMVLYKFIKIYPDGKRECIQDYSTKRMVSYTEEESGNYKLLCVVKDMYSPNEYDDRAIISFNIKQYKTINIKSFTSDLSSPQICETPITFKAIVSGGRELLYRFIIHGAQGEDSGYLRNNTFTWKSEKAGTYKIDLWVKDSSSEEEFQATDTLEFKIDETSDKPVQIEDVILNKKNKLVKYDTINIKVIAVGGTDLRYSFIVKKDGEELEKIKYGTCNWVNFTPEQGGTYEVEVLVKDKYSKRQYDAHAIKYIETLDYVPANIEYILMPARENYLVDDKISLNVITQNTPNVRLKYILNINGHKVEDTGYIKNKNYSITPKCTGEYLIKVFGKNINSNKEFDCIKDVKIEVKDAFPVTNTKIECDRQEIAVNIPVSFTVKCSGGKDVLYEFYLMEKDEWILVQGYSSKKSYSFVPLTQGEYKVLALVKSGYKDCAYEDYDMFSFEVE